jgi:hypothetical protein
LNRWHSDYEQVVAVQVCRLGESLLRQAALGAQPTQSSPKLDREWMARFIIG